MEGGGWRGGDGIGSARARGRVEGVGVVVVVVMGGYLGVASSVAAGGGG